MGMTEWKYAGYVKIYSSDRRHMVEQWDWKCSKCGYTVRKAFGNQHMPKEDCPKCIQQHAYETAVEMLQHDMLYEPTYNSEEESM